ncbi:electroneutral sodium bicarbonate exchanger 1 [Protopterus annectens]|uniref:electroneutral sodium bicarbonate exchanger 1 n=1 Tax=Protopterus annectens TaxID=7888 RepID=UPI001CFB73CB|nr:electroneutral sodium bicarbonate exchanger 1 [Protopterus annectens]
MPAGTNDPDSALSYQRHDEEAVIDQGGTSSVLNIRYEEEELEGHRTLYVGVRMPLGKQSHRHQRAHGQKHRKRDRMKEAIQEEGHGSPTHDTPSQRVQFILGTEDDEEHIAHELFTELDEICVRDGKEAEWKETARWLKFEEDVEDGGERWSKPYVATLSLHSLFELRSCIINGTVLLDMRANTFEEIADMILDHQESSMELNETMRLKVRDALLKKHHHQNEKKRNNLIPMVRSFADVGRKQSEPHSMDKGGQSVSPQSTPANLDVKNGVNCESSATDLSKADLHFMKKIPTGAEASNVLVGELEFLDRPLVAFVRLSPAVLLTGLTEVPIATRFVFILLGPVGKAQQYHEIGRSMATLMTDEIFHDVAYKAKDRKDLLAGIDEFLDQVTVLPPGEWDPSIRIEPPKNVPSQEKRKTANVPNGNVCHVEPEQHGGHSGPELERTGRIFGGLILDIKRKAPWFLSDFRDALSLQCIASFLFLYCACMSPVITFGGLLGEATEGRISAIESLFGASMTGIAYSLFAGQPLTILGSTGPVLVFEKILFKFCKEYKLSYLCLRTCIGLWTAFLCILLVATDASSLVCYITRFTEEAFAALICLIFIYEALEKLIQLGETYPIHMYSHLDELTHYYCKCSEPNSPSNKTLLYWQNQSIIPSAVPWENLTVSECHRLHGEFVGPSCGHHGPFTPDVLFWSCILFFTTFVMSSALKQFKTSTYFPTKVRAMVSDFAVFLTILTMVIIDYCIGVPSPKLQVPHVFKPTRDDRGWFISPIGENPWWTLLAAIIPALLCTILIFMDQQITAVIINRKEHKLKKGCGYHLDLLMVGIMLGVCSLMGLPWFVAATVLSITHVNSLKLESACSAPGEQPKFLGIREQRVTGLMIFVLMGCSVFMTAVLKFIPMPVLYGVFLYMGVSSLKGIQFFDRIKLFAMPAKHQPDFIYLRHVPLRKVHLFTVIQLTCLVSLWVVKASPAAIVFPMMVLALVFVRKLMDLCFSKRELSWLDDLMPESKKKKLDDDAKNKANEEEEEEDEKMTEIENEKLSQIPLENRTLLNVPGKQTITRGDPSEINISDEMSKTTVWKALSMNTDGSKTKEASNTLAPPSGIGGRDETKSKGSNAKCDKNSDVGVLIEASTERVLKRKLISWAYRILAENCNGQSAHITEYWGATKVIAMKVKPEQSPELCETGETVNDNKNGKLTKES